MHFFEIEKSNSFSIIKFTAKSEPNKILPQGTVRSTNGILHNFKQIILQAIIPTTL